MRPYLLLTPGPLTTTDTVKQAMMSDWCTWDEDYNLGIVEVIRKELVEIATSAPDEYTAVLMQGSGSFCVEATLGSVVRPEDKLLVAANGAYGKRMGIISEYYHIDCHVMRFEEIEPVNANKIDTYLNEHQEVTHVSVVHCETTTGVLNPLEEIAAVVKRHGKILILDAMSSFIIARRSLMEKCKGIARSLSLDLYEQWETMEKGHGKWRFTSPTHVVRAFMQALTELKAEGGVEARHARYCENHRVLVEGMRALGYKTLLPDEQQSPVITSFYYPSADFNFKDFYLKLKAKGFVIYPGKISQADTFRIGNIGDVHPTDFMKLIETIKES